MSDTCRLFPPFGDPWPSCLLPSQILYHLSHQGSPKAHLVKNPLAMRETWVRPLGWEDPLEKETTNPLQYSCLVNAMDREA